MTSSPRLVAICEEFFLPFDDEPAPPSDRKETAQPPTSPAYGSPLQDSLFSDAEVQEAMTKAVLRQNIEDWMAFLHPTQAKLVSRHFNGPARIRGGAGTGKTVVGLHRAAYLARMYPGREVLMTTYVKNLPDVMRSLLQRIAPDAADRVKCINVDKLAKQILEDRGHEVKLLPKVTNRLLTQAWREVGSKGPLGELGLVERYWEEEIRSVLPGDGGGAASEEFGGELQSPDLVDRGRRGTAEPVWVTSATPAFSTTSWSCLRMLLTRRADSVRRQQN